MSEKLVELQKALDELKNIKWLEEHQSSTIKGQSSFVREETFTSLPKEVQLAIDKVVNLFAVFQREHELSLSVPSKEPSLRKRVENYLIEMYGNRKCEDFEPLCPACGAWAWFDKVFAMYIYKESREGKSE